MNTSNHIRCIFYAAIFAALPIFSSAQEAATPSQASTSEQAVAPAAPVAEEKVEKEDEHSSAYEAATKKADADSKAMKSLGDGAVSWIEREYPDIGEFVKNDVWGITISDALLAAAVLIFALIIRNIVLFFTVKLLSMFFSGIKKNALKNLAEKLRRPIGAFIVLSGVSAALYILVDSPEAISIIGRAYWCFGNIFMFWGFMVVGDGLFDYAASKFSVVYPSAITLIDLGRRLYKATLILFLLLVILDLLGANVSALVASLGIGGAALAFASKDTIANFFGSVSLVADRPFGVGDWIVVGDVEGNVESIGIRSTAVRTFSKTLVTIPNSVLANESVNNMSKMPMRKSSFPIGLTYDTTPEQMLEIIADFKSILKANPNVDDETSSVFFREFADSSLNVVITYYCRQTGGAEFFATLQEINIEIMKAVSARGLSFAFPSHSLYIENQSEQKS